jgi:hypothetical protein
MSDEMPHSSCGNALHRCEWLPKNDLPKRTVAKACEKLIHQKALMRKLAKI